MHKVLERQLERMLATGHSVPVEWREFLTAISDTYTHNDEDRILSERSLDLSSKEMVRINQKIQEEEENLRRERDRARTILASMNEGLIVVDQNRQVLSINPAAQQLLGMSSQNSVGQRAEELCSILANGRRLSADKRPIDQTLKYGRPIILTIQDDIGIETRSGKKFPLAVSTAPLKTSQKIIGAVVAFRDISQEKVAAGLVERQVIERTEEAKQRRAQLQASIKNLDIGFIMADQNLSVIMINEASVNILGSQMTDRPKNVNHKIAVGMKIADIEKVVKDNLKLFAECRRVLINQRKAVFRNIPVGNLYLNFYISPVIVGKKSIGVAILVEDTTEARLLERSKDEFFSIASHELRTPLSAIRGNTAIIKKFYGQISRSEIMEMLDDIHSSSIRLIEMVSDFLDLSRLQQGKIKFNFKPMAVGLVVTEVVKELESTAQANKLYLKFSSAIDRLPAVLADRDRVKQILINLVGNALKFTDRGGVTITGRTEGKFVSISVADTGRGISHESQRLLFKKFQQAGESLLTRDTSRGTGLGLYISKLLTMGMGGNVSLIKTEPGQGSTFAFSLPLVKLALKTPNLTGKKITS